LEWLIKIVRLKQAERFSVLEAERRY